MIRSSLKRRTRLQAGLAVRGHALIFYWQVPPWLGTLDNRRDAEEDMRRAIATIVLVADL